MLYKKEIMLLGVKLMAVALLYVIAAMIEVA